MTARLSDAQHRLLRHAHAGHVTRYAATWLDETTGRRVTCTAGLLLRHGLACVVADRGRTELALTDDGVAALTAAGWQGLPAAPCAVRSPAPPDTDAVAAALTRRDASPCVIDSADTVTFALDPAHVNPYHWPTRTVLRWSPRDHWHLYDPAAATVLCRVPLEPDASAAVTAKRALELLQSGPGAGCGRVPGETRRLETALTGAA